MRKAKDLTGKRFGRLFVVKRTETDKNGHTMWSCKCECGNGTTVSSWNLQNGISKSCGCYRREVSKQRNGNARHLQQGRTIHGGAKDGKPERLYRVWQGMKTRCTNPNSDSYKNYGAKGVKVCEEWNEYAKFREWAISAGYDEKANYGECTLDRVNPSGDYSPQNCRWVDMKTQQNNKRSTQKCLA